LLPLLFPQRLSSLVPAEAWNEKHIAWRIIGLHDALTSDLCRGGRRREGGREEKREGGLEGDRERERGRRREGERTYLVVLFAPGDGLRDLLSQGVEIWHLRIVQELLVHKRYRGREGGREGRREERREGLDVCTCVYLSDFQCGL